MRAVRSAQREEELAASVLTLSVPNSSSKSQMSAHERNDLAYYCHNSCCRHMFVSWIGHYYVGQSQAKDCWPRSATYLERLNVREEPVH